MSVSNQLTNLAGATVGTAGVSSPIWFDAVPPVWQGFIAVLGAIVLVLTAWKLWEERSLARERRIREREGGN